MQTATLNIPAMHTEAVAMQVAKALETVSGVERIDIKLAHSRVRIGYDESLASPPQLRAAIESVGYVVSEDGGHGGCCGGCGG